MTEANWEIDVKKRNVCATCKHFKRFVDTEREYTGICRRYPPVPAAPRYDISVLPTVGEDQGCGEYARF
jgi:hypothetical protein